MKQEDAKKEAQRILHAPEAQQLLALLCLTGSLGIGLAETGLCLTGILFS